MGYSDKDVASRLAGALQKEKTATGSNVSVFAPDGEDWDQRLKYGLAPAKSILLLVSEDGLRNIQDAHRAEDLTLLEYEYALAEKTRSNKKVLLLLLKDRNGNNNFSAFSLDAFPHGEISKICTPPCHKSKRSAPLWDSGSKTDLLFKDRKPGERSIRETMESLFRLNGVNISNKSSDIKAVVPGIVAMLRLKLPALPSQRLTLSKNFKVEEEFNKLKDLLGELGEELIEILPLLRSKFGVGSVEDVAALTASQLSEPLFIDKGRVIVGCKQLSFIIVDNSVSYSDIEIQARIVRKLKALGLEKHVPNPDALERWTSKVETGAQTTTSGVTCLGKVLEIGGERRVVESCVPVLLMRTDLEGGGVAMLEMTDEMAAKIRNQRDKGLALDTFEGRPCLFSKITFVAPLTKEANTACDPKGFLRDITNSKEPAEYVVAVTLKEAQVSKLQKATQTALGVCPGGVSLAQTYGNLFDHRIKASEDMAQLNTSLIANIKTQDVKGVISLLKQSASANFKDDSGWTPLQRACSARVDTGDLGRNFIACNQIIELLIKAGADVGQVNSYGRTALHYAAMEGNFYAASILVHAGAPVDAKDRTLIPDPNGGGVLNGANAAFHCRLMKKNEWEKVVQLLELYSDEPPSPVAEEKKKGGKKKGKKK